MSADYTQFSKDVLGRYICNSLTEAQASARGPARAFDVVIVGGGSFGSVLAQHLLYRDVARHHRILVLDAGPFLLAEHVQNLPTLGLYAPDPVTVDPGVVRNEVWGLPWRSDIQGGFPGLAYCLGGRSVFWGGWSPRLLEAEMAGWWPQASVTDLTTRYYDEAAEQIGTAVTNDYIWGSLHTVLRQRLFDALKASEVTDAIPLAELPQHLDPTGLDVPDPEQLKLEAPLAVAGGAPRPGFFPLGKFSAMPLLIRAARQAYFESGGDDAAKRLMVVPRCHVTGLETDMVGDDGVVRTVHTNQGSVNVPPGGVVVLGAGTIESTRIALNSFAGTRGSALIGTNLTSHLRSNSSFRVARDAVAMAPTGDLQTSALFVKCRRRLRGGATAHFHLQLTACGLKGIGSNSEAELFQTIPDIDTLDTFRATDEDHVVFTIRAEGEMQSGNPDNRITLGDEVDEFGVRRALVAMGDSSRPAQPGESAETALDRELWAAMDGAMDELRTVFAPPGFDDLGRLRDGLGTAHHESGALFMGDDPAASVTDADGRFHHVTNAYALGLCQFPSVGSSNPMLTGVALARRLADHLVSSGP